VVQQAPLLDGLALAGFTFAQDGLAAAEVDVGRGETVQALVVALMIVVLDEGFDLRLERAGQIIVLAQDPVLECLVPALEFALGLRVT
jgi:hypothetical protein